MILYMVIYVLILLLLLWLFMCLTMLYVDTTTSYLDVWYDTIYGFLYSKDLDD